MKKLLLILGLLLCPAWLSATTWYACASGNIDGASIWNTASACNGTTMTWPFAATGDILDANGYTIAIDADPGVATGAGANNCGTVTATPTIETDATNGGGFTYATATNLVMHANVTATKTIGLTITGSSGGGTICGNVQGGSGTAGTIYGVSDNHTVVRTYVVGSATGGSSSNSSGYYYNGASGGVTFTGNGIAGTTGGGNSTSGIYLTGATAVSIVGNCIGSDSVASIGCYTGGSGSVVTITGNLINGKHAMATAGATPYFTPASTNYIVHPANSSYSLANCLTSAQIASGACTNAQVSVPAPAPANVLSGVNYGPYTGTASGVGNVSATGGW